MPVEHDVADQERAQFGPAPVDEAVRVYGCMGGISVDGEAFEVGTALDEHVPQTVISRDGLVLLVRPGNSRQQLPSSVIPIGKWRHTTRKTIVLPVKATLEC